MSLLIDIAGIEQVLRADGWHKIRNYSLDIGAYGFKEGQADDGSDVRHRGAGLGAQAEHHDFFEV
jgi:hypothetical protein